MKQSILKKNPQNNETDPTASTSSITNSFQSNNNFNTSRPVQTSKNVRFIGVDLGEHSDKPPDKDMYTLSRSATSLNMPSRSLSKKNNTIPLKQFSIYTKPEDGFTVVYQPSHINGAPICAKNKNHIFYYQQQQTQQLNKGLRITSATIENRLVKSSVPHKRTPLDTLSNKSTNTSVTPIRTPILISNLLASANSLTSSLNNSNDKNGPSYFYYINRSSNSGKNGGLIAANSQSLLPSSPMNKLKLKELSNLERFGNQHDPGLLSPSSEQKNSELTPRTNPSPGPRTTTPSNDENKTNKMPSSTLTLYTYLLQSNKNLPKDVRASIIRAQTKQLSNSRDDLNSDIRTKLLEDSSGSIRPRRIKLDSKTEQYVKVSSRVSSANVHGNLGAEENSIVTSSVPLTDNDSALVKS